MNDLDDRLVAATIFAAAFAFLWSFDSLSRPVGLDAATWDYMSLALADGKIPYRDVFLHKTPLAMLVGAVGAAIGPWLGLSRIEGVHALYVLLGALGPTLLYSVCRASMPQPAAAAAAAAMIALDQWPVAALEGARPKVATVVFGLAALRCANAGRPFATGAFASLATLCWQPGIAFAAGGLVELRRSARGARALAALAAGAAVPVAVLFAWLAAYGALGDFFAQAVGFNFHYIDHHARSAAQTLRKFVRVALPWNTPELLLMPACLLAALAARPRMPAGLAVYAAVYTAMAFVSFQAWPDTILLVPPAAALLGAGLFAMGRRAFGDGGGAVLALATTLALALTPTSGRLHPPIDYEEQGRIIAELMGDIDADARVLVVSLPELLIHTGRHSVWPWPYMWFGVDRFAGESSEGGFTAVLSRLDADPPEAMFVARRWSGTLRRQFESWASQHYERTDAFFYPHTVKPVRVYRRIDAKAEKAP